MTTRDDLLRNLGSQNIETVDAGPLGKVRIRPLSLGARFTIGKLSRDKDPDAERRVHALILIDALVDEQGAPLLKQGDEAAILGARPDEARQDAVTALVNAVLKLSGLEAPAPTEGEDADDPDPNA